MQSASGNGRVAVESSSVMSVGFDASLSAMEVEFASGAVYRYFSVPAALHAALLIASSRGVFFNRHIRAKFAFERA
jgi:hypothetical protein